MKSKVLISLLALFAVAGTTQAAGDAEAGKAKAQACFSCHGVNGNSVNPVWPKLAGQHAGYIAKQLADFKAGDQRSDPLMMAQVMPLSPQDMADLAAFFTKQKPSPGSADEAKLAMGEKIYRGGNKATGVSACIACHGPTGAGNPAAKYPMLSGQHAAYTVKALKDFRSGTRKNDLGKMMQNVAARMTDAEIEAVSSYMQGLH
ncbi:MAG: cytochrome c4 [Gammaproteobacteria bacterium]|nr:cytochrome c4 [Gammaproteobacteria bacterium]